MSLYRGETSYGTLIASNVIPFFWWTLRPEWIAPEPAGGVYEYANPSLMALSPSVTPHHHPGTVQNHP